MTYPENVIWKPQAGSQEAFLASSPVFEVLYQGTRGGGKSLADFTPILTDSGWKRVGEVTLDDKLMGFSGKWCNILGIYPQPLTTMRELVFRNNRGLKPTKFKRPTSIGNPRYGGLTQVVCSPDHKWLAKSSMETTWRIYTTDEMIETSKKGLKVFVPHMKTSQVYLSYWEDCEPTPHRCFAVDDPYRCYVINNWLVTHNTDCLLMSFAMFTGRGFGAEWRGVLFRRTYKELNDVINKSKKWFSQIFPQATFNNSEHFWRFPDGEELLLRQFKNADSYWDYHGHAFPWIGWEELTNWAADDGYKRMFSCSRSTKKGMPRMVRSTCNPAGIGHGWVKERFRPDTLNMVVRKDLKDQENKPEPPRLSIFSDIRENKILLEADPDYINRIAASARNEAEKKAWLYGSWDIVSGGMFDDVWDSRHNVVKPFQIPDNWRITRSFDWGSSRPFSVGWWAVSTGEDYRDSDGRLRSSVRGDVFRIAEWYGFTGKPNEGLRLLAIDISKGIVERELRWGLRDSRNPSWTRVRPGPADSQIFSAENGNCIATDMKNRVRLDNGIEFPGITWLPADKRAGSRVTGWDQMRRALKNAHPNPNGPRELPGLFVFNNCEQFIRTIPVLPRDEKDMDDIDTEAEDHCFVSETMVDTPEGSIPIGSLSSTGLVLTDQGPLPYENPRITRTVTNLVRLTMRDGRSVTCTPDHRFMTQDRFWVPAAYLKNQTLHGGIEVIDVDRFETSEPVDVYCLTVPSLGRFSIEGGIIVKNCADETRYLVRSLGQFASSGRVSGLS